MPMWIVHAPEGAYSVEDKKNLTEAITQIYVEFVDLPRFYVVVRFDEYPGDSMWLGGEPANDFVRFVVDHIARQMDDPAFRELAMTVVCRPARALYHRAWPAHRDPHRRDGDGSVAGQWNQAACPVLGGRKAMGQRQRTQPVRPRRDPPRAITLIKQSPHRQCIERRADPADGQLAGICFPSRIEGGT